MVRIDNIHIKLFLRFFIILSFEKFFSILEIKKFYFLTFLNIFYLFFSIFEYFETNKKYRVGQIKMTHFS